MRILLTTVLCVLLVACSSSDPKPTSTPTQAPAVATSAAAPTQTPVVVVVTATPVPPAAPPAATAVSAPQQSQPSIPPAAACTPASQVEVGAIAALIAAKTSVATPAQMATIRQASALVDRNGDGQIDQGVCREAIAQATQLLR